MIPIIDMANHDNRCPHWHQLTNCEEGNDDKKCFVWVAGKALEEGEEVRGGLRLLDPPELLASRCWPGGRLKAAWGSPCVPLPLSACGALVV
jgi:hypothetical protein